MVIGSLIRIERTSTAGLMIRKLVADPRLVPDKAGDLGIFTGAPSFFLRASLFCVTSR